MIWTTADATSQEMVKLVRTFFLRYDVFVNVNNSSVFLNNKMFIIVALRYTKVVVLINQLNFQWSLVIRVFMTNQF